MSKFSPATRGSRTSFSNWQYGACKKEIAVGRFFHREIANILINKDLHACLTNFIFSTIVGKQHDAASNASSTSVSSGGSHSLTTPRGAYRWMSPELLLPDTHGITDFRPTKQSDCNALGVVVCEVLCGTIPYPHMSETDVIVNVLADIRPEKPEAAESLGFTDELWNMLEHYWQEDWDERPEVGKY